MSQQDNVYLRTNSPYWYVSITPPARLSRLAPAVKLKAVRLSSKQTDKRKAKLFRDALAAKLYKQWELEIQQHIASLDILCESVHSQSPAISYKFCELTPELIELLLAKRTESWCHTDNDDRDLGLDNQALEENNTHAHSSIANYRQVATQGPAATSWPTVAEEALDWAENCGYLIDVSRDALSNSYIRNFAKNEINNQSTILNINSGELLDFHKNEKYLNNHPSEFTHHITDKRTKISNITTTKQEEINIDFILKKYEEVNKNKKQKNVRQELSTINDFLKFTSDKKLNNIDKTDIFEFFENKLEAGWSNERVLKHGKNSIQSFFATALNFSSLEKNPIVDMTVFPKKSKEINDELKRPRFPFKTNHINRILDSEWYYGNNIFKGKLSSDYGSRYFIPLIGLFHGNRVSEVTQLTVFNIKLLDGIPCFSFEIKDIPKKIRDNNELVKLISFKNESTRRTIPIHPKIIQLGFMEYIEEIKKEKENIFIFKSSIPENLTKSSKLGRAYEQKFLRFVRDEIFFNGNSGFGNGYGNHSFRHQLEDRIRACQPIGKRWPPGISQIYTGRKSFKSHDEDILTSDDDYGDGFRERILMEYILQINFEDIKLPPKYKDWLAKVSPR